MNDGLSLETIRQTSHSKLIMTPFQMHFGRKPRTAVTNLISQPSCLLSNWMKTVYVFWTKYVLAQPTELQVFTIHYSDGELADYMILNDPKMRTRSVRQNFKEYHVYEKENKPSAMKCRFKTNKILNAVKNGSHCDYSPRENNT